MPTLPTPLLTARDLEILVALDRCPLTVVQLLKLSQAFARPFTDERRVRERMLVLCTAGRVRRWLYATAGAGAQGYYRLTPLGYCLLHGSEAVPPVKRHFSPVALAHQHHTCRLADFVVHTAVAAHRAGIAFTGYYGENTVRLQVGEESLWPDASFQLVLPGGAAFGYFLEVDNSTERVRSDKDQDSWRRKILLYDRFQDSCGKRFRVLVATTRSRERLRHILDTAAETVQNRNRRLLYGIYLPAYLQEQDALRVPCFRDHLGRPTALLYPRKEPVAEQFSLPLPAGEVPATV